MNFAKSNKPFPKGSCRDDSKFCHKPKLESLIRIDGESVSVSLLLQNPGLDRARERGSGRWCNNTSCKYLSTCHFLHRKEVKTKGSGESNSSAIEIALELTGLDDPLTAIRSEETKKEGFQSLMRSADAVRHLVPIVERIMSSIDDAETPLPEDLVEVRMWCDAWIIRSTEQMEKLLACSPALQNTFFSLVRAVCERDPTSPDTRRGLAEASKLPSVSPEKRQKATEFLLETESSIQLNECNEENDQKHKRYVVNRMYHRNAVPVFNSAVWPNSSGELRSDYFELSELPGLVVDRFIPPEICELHLRVLQHLSRADFMHSLSNIATIIEERGLNALNKGQLKRENNQRFYTYNLIFNHVNYSKYDGLLAHFEFKTRFHSEKLQFLTGDLVVVWKDGAQMKDENCFTAIVKHCQDNWVVLSPLDILRSWPLFESGARFVLIRSQYFYLPTAASLSQLRIQESKMAGDNAPHLLRALLTGDGADAPPIYLSHNPQIEIGRCVALRDGSESEQPALGDWPCEEWSEEAEKKIRENYDGEKALLDRTQMDALQHIMRNRVAVVQGTPGTGKSFVGSKVLQMLLLNRKELGIGCIVVMAFTHHALESVFEDLCPFAKRCDFPVGLLGNPKSEALKDYVIRTRSAQSRTAINMFNIAEKIGKIEAFTTVNKDVERIVLKVMRKHLNHSTFENWNETCNLQLRKWDSMVYTCQKVREEVSRKLCIEIPETLDNLEKMSVALKTNTWHGAVDIMPFVGKYYLNKEDPFFNIISSLLKEIYDLKCTVPINQYAIDEAVNDVEELFSHLHNGRNNNNFANCLNNFTRGIDRLIGFMRTMPDACQTYTELWRLEGMREDHKLPPLANMRAAEREREENTKEVEVIDVDLQQIEREENERRRQERGLEDDNTDLDDTHRMTFLSVPPKGERDALVRDACKRIPTEPPGEERSQIISVILQEEMYSLQEELNDLVTEMGEEKEVLKEIEAKMNASVFAEYAVIGATSAKMMLSIGGIQRCGASVLVVEEAAEVLESHLLACITESMQHVVLIGDHKQLKPKVNEYVLERRHNFAVSTMERMVLCGLPCVTLTMQRRMTPEISALTKPYYSRSNVAGDVAVVIKDHPRTQNIPPPFGVCREDGTPLRLFFFSHDGQEEKAESMHNSMMSPENIFEAKIAACIVQYLINCNNEKSITILSPYTGQQLILVKKLKALGVQRRIKYMETGENNDFLHGVRLSTVDDYQGEEDDIIILSLVRTEKVGFLRLDNRACVALSRARSALYVIGCGDLLSGASELWRHLEKTTKEQNCIDSRFPARCNHHPERDLSFGSAEEYNVHRARCQIQCDAELECGHKCESRCHGERRHPPCQKKCERVGQLCEPPRLCRHSCKRKCSEQCGACVTVVDYTYPDCGHSVKLHCYELEDPPQCTTICTQEAECGHEVEAKCKEHSNNTSYLKCKVECGAHMSCGHVCTRNCHYGNDEDHVLEMSKCTRPQRSTAPCGHEVDHKCNDKNIALLCRALCNKEVTLCRKSEQKSLCQLKCGHGGPCNCKEKITAELPCGHTSEAFSCASTKPPPICLAPCGATLECGHKCGGECGMCSMRKFHSDCREPGKVLVCGHNSKRGCAATVNICDEFCAFHCGHGKPCDKLSKNDQHLCSECPSRMCKEQCQWQCPHGKCSKKCCEPCEFETTVDDSADSSSTGCWRRCEKELSCGHQCCGLCGERCPNFCRECYKAGDKKALRAGEKLMSYIDDEVLDMLRTDNSAEAQSLLELPCCGTIFSSEELHSLFAVKAEENEITALKCPHCRAIVLPNYFYHGDVFIKKRLLQASKIMKRIGDAAKRQSEHGVEEVISYIQNKLKSCGACDLSKPISNVRKLLSLKNKKNRFQMQSEDVWSELAWKCSFLGLGKRWFLLLRYHLDVLENALRTLRKGDSQIAKNANALSEVALKYTILADELSKSALSGYPLRTFCANILDNLVSTESDLSKAFPSAQVDEEVQSFCHKIEWTDLLYQLEPYTVVSEDSLSNAIEVGKHFAQCGVGPDEVDRAGRVKEQIYKVLEKEDPKRVTARYAASALGLSAGHWFECPNGHLYAIGECGGATQESVCPECGSKIGGHDHATLSDNTFAGGLIEDGAQPSWPTAFMHY